MDGTIKFVHWENNHNLEQGHHTFNIRGKDSNGHWGQKKIIPVLYKNRIPTGQYNSYVAIGIGLQRIKCATKWDCTQPLLQYFYTISRLEN
ncbi:hypothetical protein MHK_009601 [Candidatus Magnetomorum sp. HK-1]|nr:hypothetical protein MHK_009601 [Candidatus Magnetomorum sp. HK-1]